MKKLSTFYYTPVKYEGMMEKIDINEVERNLPSGTPVKVRGLDSADKGIVSSVSDLMDKRGISASWIITASGMSRCTFKNLGMKVGDGTSSVMLIAKRNNAPSHFSGAFGRLYFMRGNEGAALICTIVDMICTQAHNSTKFFGSSIEGNDIKVGSCTYMGESYIAIQLGSSSLFNVFFDGVFTNNCVFTQVLESNITWT